MSGLFKPSLTASPRRGPDSLACLLEGGNCEMRYAMPGALTSLGNIDITRVDSATHHAKYQKNKYGCRSKGPNRDC